MIDPECIYIGNINFENKIIEIFVSKIKSGYCENSLFLSDKDLDEKWVDNIIKKSTNEISHNEVLNDKANKNSKFDVEKDKTYLLIYILFLFKERIFFKDIINIFEIKEIEKKYYGTDITGKIWEELNLFLKEQNYNIKQPKALLQFYLSGKMPNRLMRDELMKNRNSSLVTLYLIIKRLQGSIKFRYRIIIRTIDYMLSEKRIIKIISKDFCNIRRINYSSMSGCLFFKADKMSKTYFIKCETVSSDSLLLEYDATNRLQNYNCALFLLPYIEVSSHKMLVYNYESQKSLKDILNKRNLNDVEMNKLIQFLQKTIEELSKARIKHRDITPDNIIVIMNNDEILDFKLSDFGVAILDNIVPSNIKRAKEINSTAGSSYRYADNECSDNYSAFLVCLRSMANYSESNIKMMDKFL